MAYTFDNGFISEQAKANISTMTDGLGATSIFFRPSFPLMRRTFGLAAGKMLYSPKTLDRASSIYATCIGIVKAMILRTSPWPTASRWSPTDGPRARRPSRLP